MAKTIQLLTLGDVANRTGLSLHTLRRWASERRIPVVKLGGRVLVAEQELEKFIESRSIPARRDIAV